MGIDSGNSLRPHSILYLIFGKRSPSSVEIKHVVLTTACTHVLQLEGNSAWEKRARYT